MLEENMVEFTPSLFKFQETPCFVENINFGATTFQEEACDSDLSSIEQTESGIHPLYFSLDERSKSDQSSWLQKVMELPNPITTIMFPNTLSGGTGLSNIPGINENENFYLIQRKDKACLSRLGTIEVSAWYGMGVTIDERYVNNIQEDAAFEGILIGVLIGGFEWMALVDIGAAVYYMEEMALRNVNV